MARPFDDQAKNRYVELIRRGRGQRTTAEEMGFTWGTVQRHLKEDPEFRQRVYDAGAIINEKVEEVLLDKALEGDLGAIRMWFTGNLPGKYAETRQVQVTGAGGGPIQLADVSTASLRELLTSPDPQVRQQMLALAGDIPALIETTGVEHDG